MKAVILISLGGLMANLLSVSLAHAQVYSPRRITRGVAPQPAAAPTNAPVSRTGTSLTTNAPVKPAAPAAARSAARVVPRVAPPPMDPAKVRAAKELAQRRALEFQKKRAEEGSESAQYELGMRYIRGDGVEKDEGTGRKWLELSANNGFGPASKKLEELDRSVPEKPEPEAR